MNAVIEVHEVRETMHARPHQRPSGGVAGAHRIEHVRIRPDLGVTVHARRGGGDPREIRRLHRGVTVAAVDAQAGDVMLMAERHGLLADDALIGRVRRTDDSADGPEHKTDNEDSPKDGDTRKRIGATVENLRHSSVSRPDAEAGRSYRKHPSMQYREFSSTTRRRRPRTP